MGRAVTAVAVALALALLRCSNARMGTLPCNGDVTRTFSDTDFSGDGPAIEASDACTITLTNCTLHSTDGIKASGGAVVTLNGGSLVGTTYAIDASGNAKVIVNGTKVTGPVLRTGAATVTGVPVTGP